MAFSTRHVETGAAILVRRIDLRVASQQKVNLRSMKWCQMNVIQNLKLPIRRQIIYYTVQYYTMYLFRNPYNAYHIAVAALGGQHERGFVRRMAQ